MIVSLLLLQFLFSTCDTTVVPAGDNEFHAMRYPEAIETYTAGLELCPADPGLRWRLARAYVTAGEVAPHDAREGLYRKAEEYARQCIAMDSTVAEGHTWLAAALGNIALFVGGKTKIRLANEIKRELDRALALRDDDDVTWSILGSFYYSVGSVSWFERQLAGIFLASVPQGGFEESERAFKRAIELAPESPRHRFELGKMYLDWGREEEGYRLFESAVALPPEAAGDTLARRIMLEMLKEHDPPRN